MKEVLFAVDALGESNKTLKKCVRALAPIISSYEDVKVTPVSVVPEASFMGSTLPGYKKAMVERVIEICDEVDLDSGRLPVVLTSRSSFTRAHAKKLSQFAQRRSADLVVMGTQARTGASRFFWGSFAETFLISSKVPVLSVNPICRVPRKWKKITFPTTFDRHVKKSFKRVLELAKSSEASIDVVYQAKYPLNPSAEYRKFMGKKAQVSMAAYIRKERQEVTKKFKALEQQAKAKGVKIDFIFGGDVTPISDAILEHVKKSGSDLIALSAMAGPLDVFVLGSISRQIIRRATVPVWVYHD